MLQQNNGKNDANQGHQILESDQSFDAKNQGSKEKSETFGKSLNYETQNLNY